DRVQIGDIQACGGTAGGSNCPTEDRAVVTGFTGSTNFPLLGAFDTTNQVNEAFVTKLNGAGTGLAFSTFIGGNGADAGLGIALTGFNNSICIGAVNFSDFIWITGFTRSSGNFPLQEAFDPLLGGGQDAFATLIACNSTLRFSSYLGGLSDDRGNAIVADPDGNAYLTGQTSSPDLPGPNNGPPNGFQDDNEGGGSDSFMVKIGVP
ncbi:MAG: SBBP repeat-containing protein, partial [Gammaproteobacteria bacterium]